MGADSAGGAPADRVPILEKMAELQAKAGDTRSALATLAQLAREQALLRPLPAYHLDAVH